MDKQSLKVHIYCSFVQMKESHGSFDRHPHRPAHPHRQLHPDGRQRAWGVNSPGERGVNFVLLVRGSAILTTPGSPQPIALRSGDVFIMLDDTPYRLYDHEDSALIDCVDVEKLRVGNRIEIGGGGALTTFVSGSFELDALEARPLLRALPSLLYLKLDQHRSLAFQSVLEMLALETESPGLGSAAVVSRLFELLFVHAIRAYSTQPGGPTRGWLGAIADRHLARALEAMHGAPAQDWTVESLARAAGMSRSGFAARFKAVVGQSPLDYLTQWRMYSARRLLRRGTSPCPKCRARSATNRWPPLDGRVGRPRLPLLVAENEQ